MAIGALFIGESGTGKTHSIKGFEADEVKILSVHKSILPFRGKYEVVKTPTADDIIRELHNTKKKNIVIDDFQYILGIPMMKRIGEKGWEKFNEISQPYADVLNEINALPDDVIVYIMSHVETDENGKVKIKTIGKALDKYITIEGLFMLVFGTCVIDQHYFFTTQNNGNNTVKTPEGMFTDMYIPNDLKYIEDKIRNYYYMDGAKSDEEMAAEDAAHKVNEEDTQKRKSRRQKKAEEELNATMQVVEEVAGDREEIPFDEYSNEDIVKKIEETGEVKSDIEITLKNDVCLTDGISTKTLLANTNTLKEMNDLVSEGWVVVENATPKRRSRKNREV